MKNLILVIVYAGLFVNMSFAQESSVYKINAGDIIEVSVYQEPDLSKELRVSEKGEIAYPLIGNVNVSGLTAEEVADKIDNLLDQEYFVDANVNVFIKEHAKFFVLGEVSKEWSYELRGPFNLIDAISLAGGAKENADLANIHIIREEEL
ncbi:MAG: polysaccharide export protein, partial [Candidatus Omnitrophica bacterium]|nr:polysaccharide export protein [Candidatus Omnitrophota bacterium]